MMDFKNQYIIEFIKIGDSVKVSAIDPATGTEACIVAPAKGVTQERMKELAVQKLRYVMEKNKAETDSY